MGTIALVSAARSVEVPLAATTLLGRHPTCTWVLAEAEIPTFWVELRWSAAGWAWRELGGDARGPHRPCAVLGPGWWLLDRGQRINGRSVRVELRDDGPPARFAVDLASGAPVVGEELAMLVADDHGRPLPADWERREEELPPLVDGAQFTVAGRGLRFHESDPPRVTAERRLDLERHTCRIELGVEAGRPVLTVWDGAVERKARGAALWALAPYLEARIADLPAGGWLPLEEAWARWIELCPGQGSDPERVGQDRSRICRGLRTLGVVHEHRMFERRRVGNRWEVRVPLEPERVSLALDPQV